MRPTTELFSLSDVLGLNRQLASLVLEGRFFRLHRQSVSDGASDYAELKGARRRVSPVEQVETLFTRSLERNSDGLEAFRARDERELSWGLGEVIEEADVVISNTGTKQELRINVAYLLSDIFAW